MLRLLLLLALAALIRPASAFWPASAWGAAASVSPGYAGLIGGPRAAGLAFSGERQERERRAARASPPPPPDLRPPPPSPLLSFSLTDLPGFTRSVLAPDHALITPESRTWAPLAGWVNATAAVLASPAPPMRAAFTMALVDVGAGGSLAPSLAGGGRGAAAARAAVQRAVFVLDGSVEVRGDCPGLPGGGSGRAPLLALHADGFLYLPPPCAGSVTLASPSGAGLVMWEKLFTREDGEEGGGGRAGRAVFHASASALPTADPGGGEVFTLRRLLPPPSPSPPFSPPDFNIHLMDFAPGQVLVTREVHFNQHGLLMLEGGGLYRLGGQYHPVSAGDAIWMAPFVPQWFGALGERRARYIIFKDTGADPLLGEA